MDFRWFVISMAISLACFAAGILAERARLRRSGVRRRDAAEATLTVDMTVACACGRTVKFPANFAISTGYHGIPVAPDSVAILDHSNVAQRWREEQGVKWPLPPGEGYGDAMLHRLWTRAVDAPGYDKAEWLELEKLVHAGIEARKHGAMNYGHD